MHRRRILMNMGAAVGGASLIAGSGAVSSTQSERMMEVSVKRDADGYLGIRAEDTSIASGHLNGEIQFEISPSTLPAAEQNGGQGVGVNSLYEFTGGSQDGVFSVQNQGSEEIAIYADQSDDQNGVKIYVTSINEPGGPRLTEGSPSQPLSPGEILNLGLVVDTTEVSDDSLPKNINTSVVISAKS